MNKRTEQDENRAQGVTHSLLEHVGPIARACGAAAIFVYADGVGDRSLPVGSEFTSKVRYVTRTAEEDEAQKALGRQVLHVPNVPLTRMGQAKVALFLALSRGIVERGDTVANQRRCGAR